jgi:dihydrofolate synthase/folylpolyglutamate synthase
MRDKALAEMIAIAAPRIDGWHFCDLPTPRAARAAELAALPRPPGPGGTTAPAQVHADPSEALAAAIADSEPADRIIVFGSFFTVGGVLAAGLPRLGGAHMSSGR